jgi:hypothetical protein
MATTYDLTDEERAALERDEARARELIEELSGGAEITDEQWADALKAIRAHADTGVTYNTDPVVPQFPRTVFERMVAVIDELPAIGKTQRNEQQKFMFRGHDDVMNALNPLLAKHGVFIVPDVIERVTGERTTGNNKTMYEVNLHVRFTFFGTGGDSFTASGWGEGTDMGDKATSKAMTMAFKYVVAQAFALATEETTHADADGGSAEETTREQRTTTTGQRVRREFDPGRDLAPGAIRVQTEEDAISVRQAQRDLDPMQDWSAIEDYLCAEMFEAAYGDLNSTQKREWWTRLANAVYRVEELAGPGDFPPPTPEQITEGYAWAFMGVRLALSGDPAASEAPAEAPATPDAENATEA